MPVSRLVRNGSSVKVAALRTTQKPIVADRAPESARTALLGVHPISAAIARILSRVEFETPGRPLSAEDTAPLETRARSARSAIVGRVTGVRSLVGHHEDAPRARPHGRECQ